MDAAAQQNAASQGLTVANLESALAGPFNLEAVAGRPIIVTGRSGSGKSLFLRMLADLDVNEGIVKLDGRDRRAVAGPTWRTHVTYVAAESGWWYDTVIEHFEPQHHSQALELARELGLDPDLLSASVARLSSGERQRWALIRAVVKHPRVLLLDEPTGALDQASVDRVESFLKGQIERGTILILVTHDAGLAHRMGGCRFEMVDRKLRPL